MDIQKMIEKALQVISEKQPEVKRIYKLQRQLAKVGKVHFLRPAFLATDFHVVCQNFVVPMRMYYPTEKRKNKKVILFFHGGGWVTGNIDSYNRVCDTLARQTGCRVASVDYRLAPEHPFPQGFTDCYEVSRSIFLNSYFLFDIPPEEIVLMGDSAGGNLAAAVSLKARDSGDFTVTQQILLYPVLYNDYTISSPFASVQTNGKDYVLTAERIQEYMDLYAGKTDNLQNVYLAPLLSQDFSSQPKTLVITAEFDPLRDEGEMYADKLQEAGNFAVKYRIKGALHGFFSLPIGTKAVQKAYQLIQLFLEDEVAD